MRTYHNDSYHAIMGIFIIIKSWYTITMVTVIAIIIAILSTVTAMKIEGSNVLTSLRNFVQYCTQ